MENTKESHLIWQDAVYEDEAQWRDAYEEFLNMNEENGISNTMTLAEYIESTVEAQLRDERDNLEIDIPEGIIVIGSIGTWQGTRHGYARNEHFSIGDCLYSHSGGYCKFLVEDGDFKGIESHHDGTNRYLFRKWKETTTDEEKDELRDALYNNDDKADGLIEKYTDSLAPIIAEVYGWKL